MLSGEAVPSTPMEFIRRFTEHEVTPSTFETAFSTLALHAAQLMPVTLYCSITVLLSRCVAAQCTVPFQPWDFSYFLPPNRLGCLIIYDPVSGTYGID